MATTATAATRSSCCAEKTFGECRMAAAKDTKKGVFEFTTSARIDNWIHHAVAVTQPEHDLESSWRNGATGTKRL